ncbi:tRNA (guanine-N(7)-)-methyltransferase non-catalytic subunit trm82 [Cadophora gregata f. sp. sojae]|nr:tRNA (guanine-N(7)-)-methyltransferase non-catalytic subunit trm82 [Cadophora gregata f. sp. sojae]
MSHRQMPYQCMETCGNILVAARGSSIDSFSLENGSLLSTWTCPASSDTTQTEKASASEIQKKAASLEPVVPTGEVDAGEDGPPAKKRKLSSGIIEETNEDDSSLTPDTKQEQQDGKKKKPKHNNRSEAIASGLQAPAVIALAATKDGKHVIAVTGEDKSIRVFESLEEGGSQRLQQLSQRAMPKRPCSITITADDQTIISADKFGDVYSLPLIPSLESANPAPQTPEPSAAAKPFIPAANELTIHSQRNRKALENQKRQTNRPTEKSEPTFEHKLLLGHVSMLTDIALVTVEGRNYIVTADRDEHIRISRGIPQAHIIEGFCLGHTEFITRLCFPGSRPEVLISGGGEEELYVWEFLPGKLVSKVDLKSHVHGVRRELDVFKGIDGGVEAVKFVVSGLLSVQTMVGSKIREVIVVACEGVPALFIFLLTPSNRLEYLQTLALPGNVLALSLTSSRLIVSIDTIHKPGSTNELRTETTENLNVLQTFEFSTQELMLVEGALAFAKIEEDWKLDAVGRLGNLLYGLENLRKREGDGGEE